VPQKNVLIIQEDSVDYPEPCNTGGMIFINFDGEAEKVNEIGLMNVAGEGGYITVTYR